MGTNKLTPSLNPLFLESGSLSCQAALYLYCRILSHYHYTHSIVPCREHQFLLKFEKETKKKRKKKNAVKPAFSVPLFIVLSSNFSRNAPVGFPYLYYILIKTIGK